jgi:hypothetical protein
VVVEVERRRLEEQQEEAQEEGKEKVTETTARRTGAEAVTGTSNTSNLRRLAVSSIARNWKEIGEKKNA